MWTELQKKRLKCNFGKFGTEMQFIRIRTSEIKTELDYFENQNWTLLQRNVKFLD